MKFIWTENGKVLTKTVYNADFVQWAKSHGGRWDPHNKVWGFDISKLLEVSWALYKYYSIVDTSIIDCVTIEYLAEKFETYKTNHQTVISIGGQIMAYRPRRDSPVVLIRSEIVSGEFSPRGGSRYNPRVEANGVTLRSSIPRLIYEKLSEEEKKEVKLI